MTVVAHAPTFPARTCRKFCGAFRDNVFWKVRGNSKKGVKARLVFAVTRLPNISHIRFAPRDVAAPLFFHSIKLSSATDWQCGVSERSELGFPSIGFAVVCGGA
jgi:hypothetical protein